MKKYLTLLSVALVASMLAWGVAQFTVLTSTVTIMGTSNVHDWSSSTSQARIQGDIQIEDGRIKSMSGIVVTVPVKTIKSSKGSIMDDKTWSALKYKKHPNILFAVKKVLSNTASGSTSTVKINGDLTIAGVTRNITTNVFAKNLGDGKVQFTGKYSLKMTDYGVDPPVAMFGAMTTGNVVTIKWNILVKELNN